ncbi:MAG: 4Fe-4S binding protein [Oscillospiraceae bacterium]|nr:4Fe-4S binding protein [Oscillospiraceae bacterium]
MKSKMIVLRFDMDTSVKPVIYRLVKDYDLVVNIAQANVNPQKRGKMVLEVSGEKCEEGLDYLRGLGVTVQSLDREIRRDEDKCFMCGACTGVCPTGALYLRHPSMEVAFDENNCIICGLCVKLCPVKAMEVRL